MPAQAILDKLYNAEIEQEVKLGDTKYKHYINGDWFIIDE